MSKARDFENIADIIKSFINEPKIKSNLNIACIFNHWEEIVGKEIGQKTNPTKIMKGVLFVSVASSTWANELSLMSEKLSRKINEFIGEDIVKNFRFNVKL